MWAIIQLDPNDRIAGYWRHTDLWTRTLSHAAFFETSYDATDAAARNGLDGLVVQIA